MHTRGMCTTSDVTEANHIMDGQAVLWELVTFNNQVGGVGKGEEVVAGNEGGEVD